MQQVSWTPVPEADDFENKVKKAVEGVKAETNEDLEYEEMEVNEGKNGATTIEALKKGNLYCYYKSKVNPDTYIQIMGNGVGSISMLIRITDLSVIQSGASESSESSESTMSEQVESSSVDSSVERGETGV